MDKFRNTKRPTQSAINKSLELYGILSGKINPSDAKHLTKPPPKPRRQLEAAEQTKLLQWAQYNSGKYPELALLFAIPNGGSRDVREAANLKRQGVKAGVPDLCLPVAKGGYHGLYIELKASGGRVQESQREWIDRLSAQGYRAVVCYGFEEAVKTIEAYLSGS